MTTSVSPDIRRMDARLRQLLGEERNTLVDFLNLLDKFDRGSGHAAFECGNLWQYLKRELGMLESSIARRVRAMALLRKFPQAERWLREGRLSLSVFVKLGEVLTKDNFEELAARSAGKSYRETKILVASFRSPAPAKKPVIRRVPQPKNDESSRADETDVEHTLPAVDPGGRSTDLGGDSSAADSLGSPDHVDGNGRSGSLFSSGTAPKPGPARPPKVEPVSAGLFDVSLRVPSEFVEALDTLKKIHSHEIPNGDPTLVLMKTMRNEIARHEPKLQRKNRKEHDPKLESEFANESKKKTDKPGYVREPISKATEDEVRLRDGDRCQWPMPDGRICASEHQIEMDHRISVAKGGKSTVDNLWQLCRPHNQLKATREFGEKHMSKFRKNTDLNAAALPEIVASNGTPAASARAVDSPSLGECRYFSRETAEGAFRTLQLGLPNDD